MFDKQVKEVNEDLARTGKAIIALGCSFVQGQGAVNDELYQDFKWHSPEIGKKLEIQVSPQEKIELLNKYPKLEQKYGALDFTFMEYENAFVNKLAKKYFQGKYTPINFGLSGCGNRATIKELYFHPNINWESINEIIVIYCPSGVERFDFINDTTTDHYRWKAMWPSPEGLTDPERQSLWRGYAKTIWSERFGILEQIAHVQELLTWCKLKNAKLIITPGFDHRYNKNHFKKHLEIVVSRDINGNTILQDNPRIFRQAVDRLMDLFPWNNIFKPQGFETFIDLTLAQESIKTDEFFFTYVGTGSPGMWVTPCAHPSAKAHDVFAKLLFEKISEDQ
jgi:hypothetical protein